MSYIRLASCQLIAVGDMLCIRGYWDPPADTPKSAMIEWFKSQMEQAGLVDLRSELYLPSFSGKCAALSCLKFAPLSCSPEYWFSYPLDIFSFPLVTAQVIVCNLLLVISIKYVYL
jgi:hypothetical protein